MNREVAYRKMLGCANKHHVRNLGRYLEKVQCELFNETKVLNIYIYIYIYIK
jgi:hypothetical protein